VLCIHPLHLHNMAVRHRNDLILTSLQRLAVHVVQLSEEIIFMSDFTSYWSNHKYEGNSEYVLNYDLIPV
jgi:hypothetical protein